MAVARAIQINHDDGFITWNDKQPSTKDTAIAKLSQSYDDNRLISMSQNAIGNNFRSFRDIDTNVNARTGFTRDDYDFFRPEESTTLTQKEIIRKCMIAYRKVGLIKNVIDLMGDFGCQGIKLVHAIPKQQRFYREWFKKVGGINRSERFLNTLYRAGNVIVKRSTAKITPRNYDNMSAVGADLDIEKKKYPNNEIPWRYTFFSPLQIEILGEALAQFAGKPKYALKLSKMIQDRFNASYNSNDIEKELLKDIPKDIREKIRAKNSIIELDPEKVRVFHYRKDDWQSWADPLIGAILPDVILLDKMKLADSAALDGVISNVRLWRIGDLEQKIYPSRAMINRLSNILTNNVGGGCLDLVWGPELDFKESSTNAHQFLGSEKYKPVLNAIYDGLGVPPTLTAAGSAGGFTNNIISIKTLIERLEYGRNLLIEFWDEEIKMVQQAMGFAKPAQISFDHMTLSDEAAEKALLLQLLDRDVISVEAVLDRFDEMPELEKKRIKREHNLRDSESMPKKAGPWHNPSLIEDLTKIFAQRGSVTPSEVGVELLERKTGEETQQEQLMKIAQTRQSGGTGGRPKNSKDSFKRKRTVKPRAAASIVSISAWAKKAQISIADIVMPALLEYYDKKNSRQLTDDESRICEDIKFSVLCSIKPFTKIDPEIIQTTLNTCGSRISKDIASVYSKMVDRFAQDTQSEPTLDDMRNIQVLVYSLFNEEDENA
jgi:hypothetical protein